MAATENTQPKENVLVDVAECSRSDYLVENRDAIIAQYYAQISEKNPTQEELITRLAFSEWLLDMYVATIEDMNQKPDEKFWDAFDAGCDATDNLVSHRHIPNKDKTQALRTIGNEYRRRVKFGETYDDKGHVWKGKGTAADSLAFQFKEYAKHWPDEVAFNDAIHRELKKSKYPAMNPVAASGD